MSQYDRYLKNRVDTHLGPVVREELARSDGKCTCRR
jgi:hypothetical protein